MGISLIRPTAVSLLLAALCGCASQSELASIRLDRDNPKFKTRGCQDTLAAAETHKELKNTRMVASPVLLFFSAEKNSRTGEATMRVFLSSLCVSAAASVS